MLIRIVRMEFQPEKVEAFLALFEEVKDKIAAFPGCHHVELCEDAQQTHVYYTFSKWEGENDLEKYRHSDLFKGTWEKTKALFGGKPLAYSLMQK
ncbi:MAG: hypothetical protein Tsb0034_10340 [Ekhidna sp.]